eukprot:3791422-Rhodomonas_salina.1
MLRIEGMLPLCSLRGSASRFGDLDIAHPRTAPRSRRGSCRLPQSQHRRTRPPSPVLCTRPPSCHRDSSSQPMVTTAHVSTACVNGTTVRKVVG